jgi:hypothetical protein
MGLVQQFLKSFIQEDDLVPGLFEKPDGSVWVRLPNGGESQVSDGGSVPGALKTIRVPIAFNTPGLVTDGVGGGGIVVYTPTPGDVWLAAVTLVSVVTGWDGSGTPTLWFFPQGASDYTLGIAGGASAVLTVPDIDETGDVTGGITGPQNYPFSGTIARMWRLNDATPIMVLYDDSAGANPGSSTGDGEVVLVIGSA